MNAVNTLNTVVNTLEVNKLSMSLKVAEKATLASLDNALTLEAFEKGLNQLDKLLSLTKEVIHLTLIQAWILAVKSDNVKPVLLAVKVLSKHRASVIHESMIYWMDEMGGIKVIEESKGNFKGYFKHTSLLDIKPVLFPELEYSYDSSHLSALKGNPYHKVNSERESIKSFKALDISKVMEKTSIELARFALLNDSDESAIDSLLSELKRSILIQKSDKKNKAWLGSYLVKSAIAENEGK